MTRANRQFDYYGAWHITHRCHKQEYLLRFIRDRRIWRFWLHQAVERYGLCVLNFAVMGNHIHLLVVNKDKETVPKSMQLIASRVAQQYNQRKKRKGAYWEDRYHAQSIHDEAHLAETLTYIDLNSVEAGIVKHPQHYEVGGYLEIQNPRERYVIIDQTELAWQFSFKVFSDFQCWHKQRTEEMIGEHSIVSKAEEHPVDSLNVNLGGKNRT